ncbi:MAG: heparinase II/III family protein [Rubellimicrobium sp.]|nr:heparinase II/III family protein [Rubellimicrobium sp.]
MDRLHARIAARKAQAVALRGDPEPRLIGQYHRGQQLVAGTFLLDGLLIEAPRRSIWEIGGTPGPDAIALHGFRWLDDLAALGDVPARARAQSWVGDWIARFGRGSGPGWTPALTGQRILRWITHAAFLQKGVEAEDIVRFRKSLSAQALFLARRWRSARAGLPRFEALAGLIEAAIVLEGMEGHLPPAVAALARDCDSQIGPDGAIVTRNPEELLEILFLLTGIAQRLTEAGRTAPTPVTEAIARVAPLLRGLRHSDGGLARFHGGGRGVEGRLDHALALAGRRRRAPAGIYMGFTRMAAARTTVIIDAAAPPTGSASVEAHASTLALELTSGRRPLVVNCGAGAGFGPDWRRAGRATPSHSTLGIDGHSSSRLGPPGRGAWSAQEWLTDIPARVICEATPLMDGLRFELAHDGWAQSHGLTHARILELTEDGRSLAGEDMLTTLGPEDEARFDRTLAQSGRFGIAFAVRFHLHPDVEAATDPAGTVVSLILPSGEAWVFWQEGAGRMTLEPSVYFERGRLRPRPTQQVVLSGLAISYATRVRWTLAKAQRASGGAMRDLAPSGSMPDDLQERP